MPDNELYRETHRPQLHFTPQRDWMNDPNGLVYFDGEYHLFFQHTPGSLRHGPNTWGHAVSTDLTHWKQIHHAALDIDDMGWIWSGSAVVDHDNTSGFGTADTPPLIAFYTVGDTRVTPRKDCVQAIAFSNDRGRTWTKYDGNPVLGHIRAQNRDPKVIRHEPSGKWVMALFLDENDYALFASDDLKSWRHMHDQTLPGVAECPDIFELPVDGDPANTRWVFWGGNGGYMLGGFDGRTFTPETDVLHAEQGANGYAAQTWSDIPPEDGRRIQISWMAGGKYPAMPFNQQMSYPVALTLRTVADGIRLYREPVREIAVLYDKTHAESEISLAAREIRVLEETGDLFDVSFEADAAPNVSFGIEARGNLVTCNIADETVSFMDRAATLRAIDGHIRIRLLIDRTSLEIFGNDGEVSMSFCFLPEAADWSLALHGGDAGARIRDLTVRTLRSSWRV
ncbi:2,6-beta-D-fructofuranosidase [Candidatus Poribacteria bacterium]|nr:2,6-beta-D-fructofuranosidase [Candidatus Poribacteria bacterium]